MTAVPLPEPATTALPPGARSHLRALAEALPAGSAVPVPREWVLALVGGDEPVGEVELDFTVQQLAAMFGRAVSTIRGWCAAGLFPGAYLNRGHEWRVPKAAVMAFQETQQPRQDGAPPNTSRPAPRARAGGRTPSIADWRHIP